MENIGLAFLLTIIAGLSTGIGSVFAYFIKTPKMVILSFALGLSAGVMVYVSFVELLPLGIEATGELTGIAVFFSGVLVIFLIDRFIPEDINSHHPKIGTETRQAVDMSNKGEVPSKGASPVVANKKQLMKTGVLTTLALAIHNFPEGLATFATSLSDASLGVVMTIAIAIHNIPEGISVSIPVYYATGDKKRAFFYSFISGVFEPVGALVGFLVLRPFLSEALVGSLLAFIAGIMVYIAMDEILPTAHRYGNGHVVIVGVMLGMGIMAVSLLL